jgi:type II secretory pathway pseudopilin PulG
MRIGLKMVRLRDQSAPGEVTRPTDERSRQAGFTILEIMIATAILTLGLIGILALFPVAIHTGKQIVEKSTGAVIAESVAEAIREGIRNNLRFNTRSGGNSHAYFIFRHDGVKDDIPTQKELERPDKDYFILIPRFRSGQEGTFSNRDASLRAVKTFVYPETDPNHNGGGDAFVADDDGDDQRIQLSGGQVVNDIRVEKTYSLGNFFPGLDETGDTVLEDQKIDSLKQYSFAFSIQSSKFDANLAQNDQIFQPANRLYQVKVLVYRGFLPPGPGEKPPTAIMEFDFEVSL